MYAQLTLVGNVGQDPEMRYTPSGVPVCNFSVAVNRTWTNAAGEKQEQVTWFQVTAWRRQAEICAQYLTKGDRVLIVSESIDVNPWLDRDRAARANIQVTPQSIRFLSPRLGEAAPDGSATPVDQTALDEENPFS